MNAVDLSVRNRTLLEACLVTVAAGVLAVVYVPQTLRGMLSTSFLPHAYCYLNDKSLIAVHLGSDTLIWLSYVAISGTLAYLVYRTRREIPFSWMFLAFGTFIIACGFTHFMEVVVLWRPLYWLSADVKLITAVASVITALALPPLVPKVHELVLAAKSSNEHKTDLEKMNDELSRTNESLTHAEHELRTLSGRLLRLQDDERRRLARELHDSTGQLLAAIQLNLSFASQHFASEDEKVRGWLDDSVQLTNQAMVEIRTMSYLLHPPMLDEAGLRSALQWYVEGFVKRSNIQVDLHVPPELNRPSADVELAMFRIVQEALTNIHRHSGSSKAEIVLSAEPDGLALSIRDFGTGINHRDGDKKRMGVGLRGMTERIRQLGGDLSISTASPGTLVQVKLPQGDVVHNKSFRTSGASRSF